MEKSRAARKYVGQLSEEELEVEYDYNVELIEEPKELPPRSNKHQKKRAVRKRIMSFRLLLVRVLLLLFIILIASVLIYPSWFEQLFQDLF
ncbi:hypothetical protein AJ85_13340 [Alkalihalobacillus alcalophilus ATCC 27647 = CGMCC 1.3604]|uniref:Uncharacterized protein n=1 Tax=Alkalihalobacillus alcalophilus ATCC 27647 = CGMCC 1.3604 TaxID=1218173 RepID=A0A094WN55_ALKAL|nr:hypothetical protein [Alkalihalobacillus alcalophilus]KGA99184.1 hypothetical protein BALCAV_0200595 [Alkalihalobacillus alcalophilus ATCC 27647 = CGMCC 1.3604]MED1561273.1 hypothetical protein [Alkalihalobacillus alcalophilus]THG90099.1 hypothetical protein AJ85_13340 [Alkalihalobacillus alcalophilus ATCC 27647 = CGMCC 1.3604]